jgi:hypothetical protein
MTWMDSQNEVVESIIYKSLHLRRITPQLSTERLPLVRGSRAATVKRASAMEPSGFLIIELKSGSPRVSVFSPVPSLFMSVPLRIPSSGSRCSTLSKLSFPELVRLNLGFVCPRAHELHRRPGRGQACYRPPQRPRQDCFSLLRPSSLRPHRPILLADADEGHSLLVLFEMLDSTPLLNASWFFALTV